MRFVYHSFAGRFSDSPRVLHAELVRHRPDAEHIWLVDPAHRDEFPAGVGLCEYGSAEAVEVLESADVLVANTHTDFPWSKPPGLVYLQTWHGTPLKRIHWDVLWAPEGRLERLQGDVDKWDLLISPNSFTTPLFQGAFRIDRRRIIETGYPRNDLLSAPDREEVRRRVRDELGIADGVTAALYAPTWRDDQVFAEGGREFALGLDPERLADQLGEGHCLLLRLHYMLTDRLGDVGHPAIRDVSRHPDVSELYLAADVLVTDYSSAMFDFAVTGKPIVLYAYDLEDFQDRLRGFYFDLAERRPGPLTTTTPELRDALLDLHARSADYAPAYARFRETFCHLEDGRATERVVERLISAVS